MMIDALLWIDAFLTWIDALLWW